jgi:formylglycine-generating enzyme
MKNIKLFSYLLLGSIGVASCGSGSSKGGGGTKNFTSQTGWKPNDKSGWFFTKKAQKQKGWPNMMFVEGGTFTMGLVKDDVMHDWNNSPRRMQVNSFFMSETETTNYDYRGYTTWIKAVFPQSDANYKDIYPGALPDTLVWENKLSRNDLSETYFRNPEFDYYPVVGVSWLQASRYCDWLTDRANEKALMDKGIVNKNIYTDENLSFGSNSFSLDKFKANDPELKSYINEKRIQQQSGIKSKNQRIVSANRNSNADIVQHFRLPTEVEWEFSALGMAKKRVYNSYQGKEPVIDNMMGKSGGQKGMYLDNFKHGRGDYSGLAGWGNDGSALTCDVKKFPTNDLGLYGMFGNVAEWTADVYRPIIDEEASDFNYFRGNVSKRASKNNDGTYKYVQDTKIAFDTLSDGRLVYKALPGQAEREVVKDSRNYRDGDFMSSLEAGYGKTITDSANKFDMYNSTKRTFTVDKSGRVLLKKDDKQRSSQISNSIRVVKGGSWQDMAYWLDPGQRRFKNEAKAFNWIGFRVAQDAKDQSSKRTKR